MKLLKNITALVLLTVLLMPIVTPLVLQIQQRYVKWEMIEALEKKELITITVDEASIQWIKTGEECVVNGEMFDVKNLKEDAGILTLTGLYDLKEKQIKDSIAKHTSGQQSNQSKYIVKLLLMVAVPFTESPADFCLPETVGSKQLYKQSFYISPFKNKFSPPPDFI